MGSAHVKTGTDEWLGYSGGVSSPQGKLGEPTSVSWEPIYRAQYRHPPFGGSWNSRRGHPPFERWVHYRTCGGRRYRLPKRPSGRFFVAERAVARRGTRPSHFISLFCPLLRSLMSHSSAPLRRSPTAHVSLFRPRFAYPQNPRKMAISAING